MSNLILYFTVKCILLSAL